MDKQKVDLFLAMNADKFAPYMIPTIKEKLESMSEEKFFMIQGDVLKSPTTILIIAILLGWERLFLDDIALGILKIVTCNGFGIWWLIDMFTANSRTYEYNYKKFLERASF